MDNCGNSRANTCNKALKLSVESSVHSTLIRESKGAVIRIEIKSDETALSIKYTLAGVVTAVTR